MSITKVSVVPMAGKGKMRQDKHKAKAQQMKLDGVRRGVNPDQGIGITVKGAGSAANRRLQQSTGKPTRQRQRGRTGRRSLAAKRAGA